MSGDAAAPVFEALWPGGAAAVPRIVPAPRPPTLVGRTVGFLWNSMFRGEEIFPLIERALTERHGEMRFVRPEAFGAIFGGDEHAVLEQLPERLRELGVDAVVCGMGC
jgi:hypothetical protein